MCSSTTDEIDAVALTVERLISRNDEVLTKTEEDEASGSDTKGYTTSPAGDVDVTELFS